MSSLLSIVDNHPDIVSFAHLDGDLSPVVDIFNYIDEQIAMDNFTTKLLTHNARSDIITKFNVCKQNRYIYLLNSITINSGKLEHSDLLYIQCDNTDFGSFTLKYLCNMCITSPSKPREYHFKRPFIWLANHDDIVIGCISSASITLGILKIPFNLRKNIPKKKLTKYKDIYVTKRNMYTCIIPRITQTFVYNMSSNTKHDLLDRNYSVLQGVFIESPLFSTGRVSIEIEINIYKTITKTYFASDLIPTEWDDTYYLPFTSNTDYKDINIYYDKGILISNSLPRCSFTLKSNISFTFKVYSYKPIDYQIHSHYNMKPWLLSSSYYCNDEYSYYTNQWTAVKYDLTE